MGNYRVWFDGEDEDFASEVKAYSGEGAAEEFADRCCLEDPDTFSDFLGSNVFVSVVNTDEKDGKPQVFLVTGRMEMSFHARKKE